MPTTDHADAPSRRSLVAPALVIALSCGAVGATESVDAEADRIVQAMAAYVNSLPTFSVDMDVSDEILDTSGRKLQLNATTTVLLQRPGNVYAHRRGPIADMELFAQGKQVSLLGRGLNIYTQWESAGGIDDVIDQVRTRTGLEVPAGDLLHTDSYAGLMDGVSNGLYVGTDYVGGVECHHLAFRQDQVDWQLWVQTGPTPLPMKYVITSKWVTAAPQYTVTFGNWNVKPDIPPDRFTFTAPAGAKQIAEISVDDIGRVMFEGDQ